MKGSRVQAIIRELRGEKIDIIEWSDEPSVFAANALSPAKVNQVRITDIERRQMEVIVNEDQLSLAIGKRGQNVRLATKLVGWNIDIRSEEELKKEVAAQMGALIASGGAVPLTALEGVNAATTAALAEHGIEDIDTLAGTSLDDLTEHLDISLDEAQAILDSAQRVIAARDQSKQDSREEGAGDTAEADAAAAELTDAIGEATGEDGNVEQHAVSAELDPTSDAGEVEPSNEMTNEGYDEAVRGGTPFRAESDLLAAESADPVATTEVEEMSVDELVLQETGRDLRPDTIVPAADMTSTDAALVADEQATDEGEPPVEDDAPLTPFVSATELSAPEVAASTVVEPDDNEDAADDEKQDASGSAE
jgi:N utilization substance protein A